MKTFTPIAQALAAWANSKEQAMRVERGHAFMAERYKWDFGECQPKNGWAQCDTGQDAPYFGVWANPFTLQTFTYCEGDTTLVHAETELEFVAEIHDMKKFYNRMGYGFKGIDPAFSVDLKKEFQLLGLGDFLH